MSYLRTFALLTVALLVCTATAKPKVLLGDWESAGNDIVPGNPYEPGYEYQYDCQVEIQHSRDESVFVLAQFTVRNDPGYFDGHRAQWTAVRRLEEGAIKELPEVPACLAPDGTETSARLWISSSRGQGDVVQLYFSVNMGIRVQVGSEALYLENAVYVPKSEAVEGLRSDDRIQASVTVEAELGAKSGDKFSTRTAVRRTAKLVCLKIK